MMSTFLRFLFLVASIGILGTYQNCSPVSVNEVADSQSITPMAADPAQVEIVAQGEGGESQNQNPAAELPQLSMKINECKANTYCVVDFYLAKPLADKFSFDWQTDDTKYQQDPAKYAQPAVHYVPAVGMVEFNPGETHRQIRIQALTGFTEILIPLLMDRCMLNAKLMDCRALAGK